MRTAVTGVRDLARGGFGEQRERRDCTVSDVASDACYDFLDIARACMTGMSRMVHSMTK